MNQLALDFELDFEAEAESDKSLMGLEERIDCWLDSQGVCPDSPSFKRYRYYDKTRKNLQIKRQG